METTLHLQLHFTQNILNFTGSINDHSTVFGLNSIHLTLENLVSMYPSLLGCEILFLRLEKRAV